MPVRLNATGRRSQILLAISLAALAAGAPGPSQALSLTQQGTVTLNVEVALEGIENDALRAEMLKLSGVAKPETSYTATASVRRAAERDVQQIAMALTSKGYYAATVSQKAVRRGLDVTVTLTAAPGPKFTIDSHRLDWQGPTDPSLPESLGAIGIRATEAPDGASLQSVEDQLLKYLWDNGFPSAASNGRYVEANFADATATIVLPITPGIKSRYGAIRVNGADITKANFVKALFTPPFGSPYSRAEVDAYRAALAATGLFGEVSVEPGPPAAKGDTTLIVDLTETKHRTIGGGVSFGTDVGPGATLFWENRNLFGQGETITASLEYAAPRQTAALLLSKPLPRVDGAANASLVFDNEDTDAFSAQTVTLGAALKKTFLDDNLEASVGGNVTHSQITDADGTEDQFTAFSLPAALSYNSENDPLNPTSGWRARAAVTPFFGDQQFNRVELGGATRGGFGEKKKLILALRAAFGATIGQDGTNLPATERFYAGGGGSVRGYAFQEAGPIDLSTGNPTGGASLAEANLEARYKVTEKIQVAAFVDGGSVFQSETPDFSGDFLMGAGVGVRYMTPLGPFRVDVGVPLNSRKVTEDGFDENGDPVTNTLFEDDALHLYIALGQPF